MSQPTAIPCRLFGIPARNAPRIALLRRGPSKWTRLILWQVEEDRFEEGQWFHGRIYEHRSALSPDGQLFVYFAQQLHRRSSMDPTYTYAWTAVSRPPYLTALALWPKGDCWNGGGVFASDATLQLNHSHAQPHPKHPATGLHVVAGQANPWFDEMTEDEPISSVIRESLGWRLVQPGRIEDKREQFRRELQGENVGPDGKRRRLILQMTMPTMFERPHLAGRWHLRWTFYGVDYNQLGDSSVCDYVLRDEQTGEETLLPDVSWADWDQRGRLAFTRDGALYAIAPDEVAQVASAVPLRDFNDQRPTALKSPLWAKRWPARDQHDSRKQG
jgi:hypothetical protein